MKFAVEGDHRQFFRKNGMVEVEGILTESQLKECNNQVEKVLEERLNAKPSRAFYAIAPELFIAGRDFWRSSDFLKKMLLHRGLAEIASDLIETKPLRYGFDQLFFTANNFNPYKELANEPKPLVEVGSILGVSCGIMICLAADSENKEENLSIFSQKPGSAVFFSPELPIDYSELQKQKSSRYLMVVYAEQRSIYYLEDKDPQTHAFKKLGYVFGDRLTDKLNPIVYR